MQQIPIQTSRVAFELQGLVDDSVKVRCVAAVKPSLEVRIPSRVSNPTAQVPRASCHFVDGVLRRAPLPVEQRRMQCAAQFFVGVQRQDPVMAGRRRRDIFLFCKICPGMRKDFRAVISRDLHRAVLASAIHNHNFVSNSFYRIQDTRQVVFLVARNQAGGKEVHRAPREIAVGGSISQRQSRGAECQEESILAKWRSVCYFGWKFTRIMLPPIRNSAPSSSIAARTRSSSKKVPFVESISFRLM